ncbi:hypothetical protein [[Kitasatospora] papulosa]|uniref:hypothetical protein n=1 Tax=[Kitasatospora] papulosa TaxID=1464011 RepID=UPI0039A57400
MTRTGPHRAARNDTQSTAAEIAAFEGLWSLKDEGRAVVLVTHRLAATAHADRIYVSTRAR